MTHLSPVILRQYLKSWEPGSPGRRPSRWEGPPRWSCRGGFPGPPEDIDLVDEVPVEIREERQILEELSSRYRLRLAHFRATTFPSDGKREPSISVASARSRDGWSTPTTSSPERSCRPFKRPRRFSAPGPGLNKERLRELIIGNSRRSVRRRSPAKGDPELVRGLSSLEGE